MIFGREPALIAGAIRAIILLGVSFGLNVTEEQLVTIMLAVEAILTLITRQVSTPTAAPRLAPGTVVQPTDGGATTTIK